MEFFEYLKGLPDLKTEEIKKIAEVTYSSTFTVYRWIRTGEIPELKKKAIAEYYGKPIEELFPPQK